MTAYNKAWAECEGVSQLARRELNIEYACQKLTFPCFREYFCKTCPVLWIISGWRILKFSALRGISSTTSLQNHSLDQKLWGKKTTKKHNNTEDVERVRHRVWLCDSSVALTLSDYVIHHFCVQWFAWCSSHQRLFGDDRNEPVQVQALKDYQSNYGGLFVLVCRVRCSLWINQADGGAGTSISLKTRHWSVIHPGDGDENILWKWILPLVSVWH